MLSFEQACSYKETGEIIKINRPMVLMNIVYIFFYITFSEFSVQIS